MPLTEETLLAAFQEAGFETKEQILDFLAGGIHGVRGFRAAGFTSQQEITTSLIIVRKMTQRQLLNYRLRQLETERAKRQQEVETELQKVRAAIADADNALLAEDIGLPSNQ
jgi:hypothetical protein